MRESRLIFPECGISYFDVIGCAGMNQVQAAKRLGIGYSHFSLTIKRLGMTHWFDLTRTRPRKVGKEEIVQVASEGYTMGDAAHLLDTSYSYFRHLVKLHGLNHLFPNSGKAKWISKRGYCS